MKEHKHILKSDKEVKDLQGNYKVLQATDAISEND